MPGMQAALRADTELERPALGATSRAKSTGSAAKNALSRLIPTGHLLRLASAKVRSLYAALRVLEKANASMAMQLDQFRAEQQTFGTDEPVVAGSGRVLQIVPPFARANLRSAVGCPGFAGHLFVADAWHCVLSRFLKENSTVLDMGCGCGKDARSLLYHPYVEKYIGFDAYRPNIDWCLESIAPRTDERFEFYYIDVLSDCYNPKGTVRGTEVVFPTGDRSIDLAFAASLFTHLLEPDANHYLREVTRVLAPGGLFLPTILVEPAAGTAYSGNEIRIDVDPDYFIQLAHNAGLRLKERLGVLCGQEALLFTKG
jgi:SAM-dependent methyltransferase